VEDERGAGLGRSKEAAMVKRKVGGGKESSEGSHVLYLDKSDGSAELNAN